MNCFVLPLLIPSTFARKCRLGASCALALCVLPLPLRAQSSASPESHRPWVSANVIDEAMLRSHPELVNAYNVIAALHSNWLIERNLNPSSGATGRPLSVPDGWRSPPGVAAGVQVYFNGHRLGGTDMLRNIPSRGVSSIRYIDGIEAQGVFGAGHSQGVIYVATTSAFEWRR